MGVEGCPEAYKYIPQKQSHRKMCWSQHKQPVSCLVEAKAWNIDFRPTQRRTKGQSCEKKEWLPYEVVGSLSLEGFKNAAYHIPSLEIHNAHQHIKGSEKSCSKETCLTQLNAAFPKLLDHRTLFPPQPQPQKYFFSSCGTRVSQNTFITENKGLHLLKCGVQCGPEELTTCQGCKQRNCYAHQAVVAHACL